MYDIKPIITKLQDGYNYIYNFLNKLPQKRYYIGSNGNAPEYPITNPGDFDEDGIFGNDILAMRINKNNDVVEIFIDKSTDGEMLDDENEFWCKEFQEDMYDEWQILHNDYIAIFAILMWANRNNKLTISESQSINYQNKKNGTIIDDKEIKLKDYDIIL